ncbi:MAG: hypothetical protein AAF587_29810 [Bacteroidota bacterium]
MSIKQFSGLSSSDSELLLKTPALVTVLVAGADQNIDKKEKDWAAKLVHYRTFTTETRLLHEYYEAVQERFESDLDALIGSWDADKSQETITAQLTELNTILPQLEADIADLLKDSWRSLARKIAEASGGFLGFGSVDENELKVIDLAMIK